MDIIPARLHFSVTPKAIAQWMFIATIRKAIERHSIFLLEPVWTAFQSPLLVLEGNNQGYNNHTEKHPILSKFELCLEQHPLATPHSSLSKKLDFLHRVVMDWFCESWIDSKAIEKAQVRFTKARSEIKLREAKKLTKSKIVNVDIVSLPQSKDDQRMRFVDFLRCGMPLLRDGVSEYMDSSDKFLQKIARTVDKFMPYREHAPTHICSQNLTYDDPEWLRTSISFWNILCFCGVFYGLEFAQDDGRHSEDLGDWKAFSKNKPESYFIVKSLYRSLQGD